MSVFVTFGYGILKQDYLVNSYAKFSAPPLNLKYQELLKRWENIFSSISPKTKPLLS